MEREEILRRAAFGITPTETRKQSDNLSCCVCDGYYGKHPSVISISGRHYERRPWFDPFYAAFVHHRVDTEESTLQGGNMLPCGYDPRGLRNMIETTQMEVALLKEFTGM
jgi:hypothetical protein